MLRIAVFLLIVLPAPAIAQPFGQPDLVPVTIQNTISKKKVKAHAYRIGILPSGDSIHILAYGMTRLPRSLKQLKFTTAKEKFTRGQIAAFASSSLDSVYRFLSDTSQELTYRAPRMADYRRGSERFLSGRKSPSYFSSQWIRLVAVPAHGRDVQFFTRALTKKHNGYLLDHIPGAVAGEFPALDPWNCVPAPMRFFNLRKMQGYGLARIKHTPYVSNPRVIIRKSFNVFFNHNETVPDAGDIENVERYLEENNYVILKAELEGGCSIEGSPGRNLYLQKKRAAVLQRSLRKYADEFLKRDTVILTDFIAQFRELIRRGPFSSLDTLADSALVARVNSDEVLRRQLEDIFIVQRKASLNLVMAKRLSRAETFEKFLLDFHNVANRLHNTRQPPADLEPRLLGMIERLFGEYESHYISAQELHDIIDETPNPDFIHLMIGIHLLKKYEQQPWGAGEWPQYWRAFGVGSLLHKAQESAIRLARHAGDPQQRKKFIGILVDFQAYTYRFVEMNLIDINTLCDIPYPETALFMGLILNQYAYLFEAAEGGFSAGVPDDRSPVRIYCVPGPRHSPYTMDSVINTDQFLDRIEVAHDVRRHKLVGQRLVLQRSFNDEPKGAYYYLLKQYFLKNNKTPLAHVEQPGNTSSDVKLDVFNLWHLVRMNVDNWDPLGNKFYDREVLLDEMERLIAMLKHADHGICRQQVNTLYLRYHLNVLYYLERYAEPGNPKHEKYADNALKFISAYYKSRAHHVNPRLALHLAMQFNLLNWLPGRRAGSFYGYELLNTIARVRPLSSDEGKLYAHYLRLYDPQLKKVPATFSDRRQLTDLMNENF